MGEEVRKRGAKEVRKWKQLWKGSRDKEWDRLMR